MKIAVIDVKPRKKGYIAKEMSGGFGKKIHLTNSLFGSILNWYLSARFNAPPIMLAQAAGICKAAGHEVTAYHTHDIDDIHPLTKMAIVLSSMVDYRNEVTFVKDIKAKFPTMIVIVVGAFASVMPEIFSPSADCVIVGSPDLALQKILREGLPSEKTIQSDSPEDLDTLPPIDWEPFFKSHIYAKRPFSRKKGICIQKSRGCSMTCQYCPYAAFFGKARQFSVDYTFKTIEFYYHKHNIRYFMFRDPNFGENRKEFHRFMERIIDSGLNLRWSCEARLDTFNDDELRLMHRAGLGYVIIGVESDNLTTLNSNSRIGNSKDDIVRKVGILESQGVVVQANYIIGFPQETEKNVCHTISFAKALNTMFANFNIFTPQPGTMIFDKYRDKLLTVDWEDYNYSKLVWRHPLLSKEFLEQTAVNSFATYYFRLTWLRKHGGNLAKILFM
ncbi:MAG: B12-binding domain-containing radical SAM protein [Kiritimatiellae bacterium]|nr:B12-binding domain-containing radical SAM protein [Kiritimatiellia bacterium]